MRTDDTDNIIGQLQALRALLWAMIDAHPDVERLSQWFAVHAEAARTRNLNEPVSEASIAGFESGVAAVLAALRDEGGRRSDSSALAALLARLPRSTD